MEECEGPYKKKKKCKGLSFTPFRSCSATVFALTFSVLTIAMSTEHSLCQNKWMFDLVDIKSNMVST